MLTPLKMLVALVEEFVMFEDGAVGNILLEGSGAVVFEVG